MTAKTELIPEDVTPGSRWDEWLAVHVMGCHWSETEGFWCDGDDPAKPRRILHRQWSPTTEMNDARFLESQMDEIALYMGRLVRYEEKTPHGYQRRGVQLRELYTLNLFRLVNEPVEPFMVTTMDENNWIERKFRSDELWNLLRADPLQRSTAVIMTIWRLIHASND